MAAKSSEWRPGPTVCRCCLTEGCYKDISTEYFWMGKREVYAEMLKDTLDVSIAYSKAGGPNSNSRLICEPCISRLRDATEFKRQVVECERMFMQHLDPGSSSLSIEVDPQPLDKIKIEGVKLEKGNSDDEFDDRHDFGMDDDDDDDDDLDNQPLTKLASKVPKKESVDLLDLLDNSKAAEKRKSTTKAKAPPLKKAKAKVEAPKPKPTSSKPKPEKKKKVSTPRENAEILVKYTTAYPFRVKSMSMYCVYCAELNQDPDVFRRHMKQEHSEFYVKMISEGLPRLENVKVDISELACRICGKELNDLTDAATHIKEHGKCIDDTIELGLIPFKLDNEKWSCVICDKCHPTLLHLNKHTVRHFTLSYVCETCGKSYVTSTHLLQHVRAKHEKNHKSFCRRCQQWFPTSEAKLKHQKVDKRCMLHCCSQCPERFSCYKQKQQHMIKDHGQEVETEKCPACDFTYTKRRVFYDHFKSCHT